MDAKPHIEAMIRAIQELHAERVDTKRAYESLLLFCSTVLHTLPRSEILELRSNFEHLFADAALDSEDIRNLIDGHLAWRDFCSYEFS